MKTILLVRHADVDVPAGPVADELVALNAAGRARAADLARAARAAGVTTVLTSLAVRARETGAAAAAFAAHARALAGTPQQFATAALAADGPAVLIVGHSNTVPQILSALGATIPGLVVQDFDDLFVVTVDSAGTGVVRLKYGAAPAPAPVGPVLTDRTGRIVPGRAVALTGDLFAGNGGAQLSVSGGAVCNDLLVLVADEMKKPAAAQVLRRAGDGYTAVRLVDLYAGKDEVDLEAVAADGETIYVTGSHAWVRKIDGAEIGSPKRKESREQFFRFRLHPDGNAGAVEGPKSLRPALAAHPVLGDFIGLASKENGIDIEGLAARDGRLHFGFRGPVLRGGWVPVLSCTWDDPTGTARVRYVRLGGRGVRDITAVAGGFLILAGPVGDGDAPFRVYFWDGTDQLPAGDTGSGALFLAEFARTGAGRPEGLLVLDETATSYELLVLIDGLPQGGPLRWSLAKP